jgi:hypothetical protein
MNHLMTFLRRTLDFLGLTALAVTALLLGGSFWFVDDFLKGIMLSGVFPWLLASVALFAAARVIELVQFALSIPVLGRRTGRSAALRRSPHPPGSMLTALGPRMGAPEASAAGAPACEPTSTSEMDDAA